MQKITKPRQPFMLSKLCVTTARIQTCKLGCVRVFFFTLNFKHHFQAFLAKRVKAQTAVKAIFKAPFSSKPILKSWYLVPVSLLIWKHPKLLFFPTNSVRPLSPGQKIFTDGEQSETSSTKTRINAPADQFSELLQRKLYGNGKGNNAWGCSSW